MERQYDLIVIGGGPGGYVAAIRAARLGLHTALIERDEVGGTCLNRGCIPTKTLMHSSHLYRELEDCEELGLSAGAVSYNIKKLYARKCKVTEQLRGGIEQLLKANKVDVIRGNGVITGSNTVAVEGDTEEIFTAGHILIAAGSVPVLPPIDGITLPGVITSDELLDQEGTDYRSLVIIGGGVIGVEFATIFQALGCQVTIIEAMDRLLPGMDKEISQNLTMILKKRGITIHTSASVEKLESGGDGVICHFSKKEKAETVSGEAILAATGRRANLAGLFADGVEIAADKGIIVNDHFQTSIPGIYAVGDIIHGGIQLAHAASAQACNAVDFICNRDAGIDLLTVPSCVYTDPEIAVVGLDAAAAKEQGIEIKTGKFLMGANGKSIIENQERGFIKLVFDANTEIILGAQLMCARATDLISELGTAIVNRLTVSQLSSAIRPHPTFSEGITEAVEDVCGLAIHIAPRRR